jgi:hypothetical protein
MVDRYRPAHKRNSQRTTNRRATSARVFVCFPKPVLQFPPIQRRNAAEPGFLSTFDIVVAAAIATLARAQIAADRHAIAFGAGKKALRQQRRELGKGSKWLNQYQVGGVNYEFKLAGSTGYLEGHQTYDDTGRDRVVAISKSGLLAAAQRSVGGKNHARLSAALARLRQPVRVDTDEWPALLVAAKPLPDGRLSLTVDRRWLPSRKFGRLPLPLPTQGATVLALYLFLAGIDGRTESRTNSIKPETLYRRLGIPLSCSAHAERRLDYALRLVNAHLAQIRSALAEHELPIRFGIDPLEGGDRIRFHAILAGHDDAAQRAAATVDSGDDDWDSEPAREREHRQREREHREREFAQQQEREQWAALRAKLGAAE